MRHILEHILQSIGLKSVTGTTWNGENSPYTGVLSQSYHGYLLAIYKTADGYQYRISIQTDEDENTIHVTTHTYRRCIDVASPDSIETTLQLVKDATA